MFWAKDLQSASRCCCCCCCCCCSCDERAICNWAKPLLSFRSMKFQSVKLLLSLSLSLSLSFSFSLFTSLSLIFPSTPLFLYFCLSHCLTRSLLPSLSPSLFYSLHAIITETLIAYLNRRYCNLWFVKKNKFSLTLITNFTHFGVSICIF